jgi:hypothetical protein
MGMRHYYCEAEEVVVHDMRDPVTAREALQEGELREAPEMNLLACTVRCLMCMSNMRKLPLTFKIPGARTPLRAMERQRTRTKRLKVVVGWTWEERRAWIVAEPAGIVTLRIEHLLNDSTCFRSIGN